jgi:ABC-type tungstate transport system permease subunit
VLQPGDICIVNEKADKVISGIYRSLIGKRVVITSSDTVFNKYPIRVLNPDKEKPWENSSQLQMREDLLTKEC